MEYRVIYGIDGGISHGFGLKSPDYHKKEELIDAETNFDALFKASRRAYRLSRDHLSNPTNDLTTVTLLALFDPNSKQLNQKKVLKEKGYVGMERFYWKEEKLVVECSMLEHLLSL